MAGEGKTAEIGRREHVLMVPFMAQGHLIPFVSLARLLEARTPFTITLVNTPLNICMLRSLLPSTTTIRLSVLPFCSADHGLPPDSENTDTLNCRQILRLCEASETLQPPFERLVSDISRQDGHSPLCIISDIFFGWTVNVASKFGIFHTVFSTCGAYGTAVYFSLWLHLPHTRIDYDEFELPDFPGIQLHRSQLSNGLKVTNGKDPWAAFLTKMISFSLRSAGMLCNAVKEMETIAVQQLSKKMMGRPVWTIGPLLPPSLFDSSPKAGIRAGKKVGITSESCVEWLDLHPPASVLYISFGSQNTLSTSQMMELAMGLDASDKPFIWVVRPPSEMPITAEFRAEWLPELFEERMMGMKQGLLVRNWAPQLEILSHRSTGAFLSHCGWNSVLEALSHGVPIIGWPLAAEQFYNSKLLEEELGVCVELARGIDSEVSRDQVDKLIGMVINGNGKGREMREKAGGLREALRSAIREDDDGFKGSSVAAMDSFINTALSMRQTGGESSVPVRYG